MSKINLVSKLEIVRRKLMEHDASVKTGQPMKLLVDKPNLRIWENEDGNLIAFNPRKQVMVDLP